MIKNQSHDELMNQQRRGQHLFQFSYLTSASSRDGFNDSWGWKGGSLKREEPY